MIHVTCIAYAIFFVAEQQLRGHFFNVNKLVANGKKNFKITFLRKRIKQIAKYIHLPLQPLIIR